MLAGPLRRIAHRLLVVGVLGGVFLFEGPHAEQGARRLLSSRRVLSQAGRIGLLLEGVPRTPEERFSWERPARLDGVAYGAQPGPGYSEGGPGE